MCKKKCGRKQNFDQKKLLVEKNLIDRNFLGKKRFLVKKSWSYNVWSKDILVWKIFRYQKFEGPKSLVKMRSSCLDIAAAVDKCHQGKCFLDKCYPDS